MLVRILGVNLLVELKNKSKKTEMNMEERITKMNELAIVILNWNGSKDTIECLESLVNGNIYDIYLFDNGSSKDEVIKIEYYLKESKYKNCYSFSKEDEIKVGSCLNFIVSEDNKGFANGNNYVVKAICDYYKYIMLLNNDTEVPRGTIESMLTTIKNQDIVAVTCDIRYHYDRKLLWNAGGKFNWYQDRTYYTQKKIDTLKKEGNKFIYADFITGCALMIDSDYIKEYGLFSEKFFHGEEDFNFCKLVKQRGKRLGVDLSVELYHKVGGSLKPNEDLSKSFNATTIHYCNRIIDQKAFMNKVFWCGWRRLYLMLIYIKRIISGSGLKYSKKLVCRVKHYTDVYEDVDKEKFDMIMKEQYEK